MTYLLTPLLGLLIGLLSLTAPVLMLFALPFIRWDKTESVGSYGIGNIKRGDLPLWLSGLSTPDERLPGGMYEPAHLALYEKYGKWVASWYWLGIRNRMIGVGVALGRETTDYAPDGLGFWQRGDMWRFAFKVGVIKFLTGYKIYKLLDGRYQAAPAFSIMVRR